MVVRESHAVKENKVWLKATLKITQNMNPRMWSQ